jgi:hypothetical protein
LGDQIENEEVGGAIACMGEIRISYKVSVGEREDERPLGRPRHRWEKF